MPETTEQVEGGGSKVAEALEHAIERLREVGPNEVHKHSIHVRTGVASELEELLALLADYIPVSALLSDEVVEEFRRAERVEFGQASAKDGLRRCLQAAVDHLGGTDAH